MKLVVLGLSLSSSWGNGHATTYRALLKAFAARGHDVVFLERDVPWYAAHRDPVDPAWPRLEFYADLAALERWRPEIASADAVMVGSYTPEGAEVGRRVQAWTAAPAHGSRPGTRPVVAFYDIDTPVTLARLAGGACDYLSPELVPGYDLYLSFTGGPTLERIERDYGAPAARALYCSVDAEAYRPVPAARRWDLSYLGTYSDDRQPTLERLLIEPARRAPHLRFVVAGPQYPADIDWPANVERFPHVGPADHPLFYGSSRYTLNVTRADMVAAGWSPSVRLFEASACACPVITDAWPGLGKLFAPEKEIVVASSPDAVLRELSSSDDARRDRIAAAARARVLAEHTSARRAGELERALHDVRELRVAANLGPRPVATKKKLRLPSV